MKHNFKENDIIFHHVYGWGTIDHISLKVGITFNGGYHKYLGEEEICMLSFTEYTLQGATQERPKEPLAFNEGDVVYVTNSKTNRLWSTIIYKGLNNNELSNRLFKSEEWCWKFLTLENPLKFPDTKIYSKEDL